MIFSSTLRNISEHHLHHPASRRKSLPSIFKTRSAYCAKHTSRVPLSCGGHCLTFQIVYPNSNRASSPRASGNRFCNILDSFHQLILVRITPDRHALLFSIAEHRWI